MGPEVTVPNVHQLAVVQILETKAIPATVAAAADVRVAPVVDAAVVAVEETRSYLIYALVSSEWCVKSLPTHN